MDVQREFADPEEQSTSEEVMEILERFKQIFQKRTLQKVSKLTTVLSICLVLIQDKDAIAELHAIIEETPIEPQPEKKFN